MRFLLTNELSGRYLQCSLGCSEGYLQQDAYKGGSTWMSRRRPQVYAASSWPKTQIMSAVTFEHRSIATIPWELSPGRPSRKIQPDTNGSSRSALAGMKTILQNHCPALAENQWLDTAL
jgi:hypothetical protein